MGEGGAGTPGRRRPASFRCYGTIVPFALAQVYAIVTMLRLDANLIRPALPAARRDHRQGVQLAQVHAAVARAERQLDAAGDQVVALGADAVQGQVERALQRDAGHQHDPEEQAGDETEQRRRPAPLGGRGRSAPAAELRFYAISGPAQWCRSVAR